MRQGDARRGRVAGSAVGADPGGDAGSGADAHAGRVAGSGADVSGADAYANWDAGSAGDAYAGRDAGPGRDVDADRDADPVRDAGVGADPGRVAGADRGLGAAVGAEAMPSVVWRTRAVGTEPEPGELAWLSSAERVRADGFPHAGPRARFVVARAVLRQTLEAVCPELDGRACPIPPTGPPRLDGGNLHLSLAHTDGLAAVAVSDGQPVGIDVEPWDRDTDLAVRAWLTASEVAGLAPAPDVRGRQLLQLWTAKEAVIKAFGGRAHDPVDVTRLQIVVAWPRRPAGTEDARVGATDLAGTGRPASPEAVRDGSADLGGDGRQADPEAVRSGGADTAGDGQQASPHAAPGGSADLGDDGRQLVGVGTAAVQGQADPVSLAWYLVAGRYLVALAVCGQPSDVGSS